VPDAFRYIRLVLTAGGPTYVSAEIAGAAPRYRRVGNLLYDHSFAEVAFREIIMNNGKAGDACVCTRRGRLALSARACGSGSIRQRGRRRQGSAR
jgi:hypothetical protein